MVERSLYQYYKSYIGQLTPFFNYVHSLEIMDKIIAPLSFVYGHR